MQTHYGIGLMSGTSMDGIDLAYCRFEQDENELWNFEIICSECIEYPDIWYRRLVNLSSQSAEVFAKTNIFYGHFLGKLVGEFITKNQIKKLDFVSSHGQTIFHQPKLGYTIQIGHGAAIAKESNCLTITDLRTSDVAFQGQGAPIVPLGERDLFPKYHQFVNIGGITNLSIHRESIIGFDVCMGNIVMDELVKSIGLTMDKDGKLARKGTVNAAILDIINKQDYFSKTPPKTLHAQDVINKTIKILDSIPDTLENNLATLVEHIAIQLSQKTDAKKPILLTGGGAFNTYLVERIQTLNKAKINIPNQKIVALKEAVIISYLGLLRMLKIPNSLKSVTGATKNAINGAIYLP